MFLAGLHFEIVNDNQSLLGIFRQGKQMSEVLSPHMLHWVLLLSNYEYILTYRPGKKHVNADFFSRVPVPSEEDERTVVPEPAGIFLLDQTSAMSPLSAYSVAAATIKDSILSEVRGLQRAWNP